MYAYVLCARVVILPCVNFIEQTFDTDIAVNIHLLQFNLRILRITYGILSSVGWQEARSFLWVELIEKQQATNH